MAELPSHQSDSEDGMRLRHFEHLPWMTSWAVLTTQVEQTLSLALMLMCPPLSF